MVTRSFGYSKKFGNPNDMFKFISEKNVRFDDAKMLYKIDREKEGTFKLNYKYDILNDTKTIIASHSGVEIQGYDSSDIKELKYMKVGYGINDRLNEFQEIMDKLPGKLKVSLVECFSNTPFIIS